MIGRRVREWRVLDKPMAKAPAVDSGSDPVLRAFAFAGTATAWEPIDRHLEIGPRAFGLAPGVPVTGLAAGVHVAD
jgi:hypothetical protein